MISVDFAPNETGRDVFTSLHALLSPWKHGAAQEKAKQEIASRFGVEESQVFLFLSGRSAIYTILKALGCSLGDEVIVPGFTCEAVVLPIQEIGATPIYVDIEPGTYSATASRVQEHIGTRTKALFLQHTFGMTPRDREELLSLTASKGISVIEDLAHGFSSQVMRDHEETIKVLSFGRSKAFSSVFGGALIVPKDISKDVARETKNIISPSSLFILQTLLYVPLSVLIKSTYDIGLGKVIHAVCRSLHILSPEISRVEKSGKFDSWLHRLYPNALAILLLPQLHRLTSMNERRAQIAHIYTAELFGGRKPEISIPISRFPVLVKNRSYVLSLMHSRKIYLGSWYVQPIAPQELDMSHLQYENGSCPTAERVCEHIINLPLHVSRVQAREICRMIKPFVL